MKMLAEANEALGPISITKDDYHSCKGLIGRVPVVLHTSLSRAVKLFFPMLKTDLNILAKILAQRLQTVLPSLICLEQTCAVKGRTIQDSLHLVRTIVEKVDRKAFDRVCSQASLLLPAFTFQSYILDASGRSSMMHCLHCRFRVSSASYWLRQEPRFCHTQRISHFHISDLASSLSFCMHKMNQRYSSLIDEASFLLSYSTEFLLDGR